MKIWELIEILEKVEDKNVTVKFYIYWNEECEEEYDFSWIDPLEEIRENGKLIKIRLR